VTAYGISPVGAHGVERHREQEINILSKYELLVENEGLRKRWAEAVDQRIAYQVRLSQASRVLASLGRLSPRMAALVEVSRREIWRLDRGA
jgi:hypothetical protein